MTSEELIRTGRDLYRAGLVSTRGGNISIREAGIIRITRTTSALGRLTDRDIIDVPSPRSGEASSDLAVHEAIYSAHDAAAIVHAHGVEATALSMRCDEVRPVDHEGALLLGSVPVVDEATQRRTVGERVASAGGRIVVVRSHGTYAWGTCLEEAEHLTTALEMSAAILLRVRRFPNR